MIMTDQDHDGSHIKGLIINFIHCYWPALLKHHDFVREFVTPIVKVSKARHSLSFFTLKEYADWRLAQAAPNSWAVKYYKGLGTSTSVAPNLSPYLRTSPCISVEPEPEP